MEMEPSTAGKLYQYLRLPKANLFYRILTLYPALDFSATIRVSLRNISVAYATVSSSSYGEFEALSYAWGDKNPTATIEFPDGSHLPIRENLESFLRYRRQHDHPLDLWIDAICINQDDAQEKSSQVQVMGRIYAIANRLSIWLGPPEDDSPFAIRSLLDFSGESAFVKLGSSVEENLAIEHLLSRAWWIRIWIVQEVALGGLGMRYTDMTVWCGPEQIPWHRLVLACARMHANRLNMRQTFPSVKKVLKLDVLASRRKDEFMELCKTKYSSRLLRYISEYRDHLASDPRDKIYALLGLWGDSCFGLKFAVECTPAPAVNYSHSVERIYTDFASWILDSTQSLEILSHCQSMNHSSARIRPDLPTWVPDWSCPLSTALLASGNDNDQPQIPWWSLPICDESGETQTLRYGGEDQVSLRKRADKILRPVPSSLHYIPEWAVDSLDPDGSLGVESFFKELQLRKDHLFFFPDESDRALGNEEEDMETILSRTQRHNERMLQKEILSEYVQNSSMLQLRQLSASGHTPSYIRIEGKELHVRGIFCDTIDGIGETFPEELEKEWTNSTLLMIQIGKCKHDVMEGNFKANPYISEQTKLEAFWRTIFAGQHAQDEKDLASWLPVVQAAWQLNKPVPTVLESGRLEHAEMGLMVNDVSHAFLKLEEGTYLYTAFDNNLKDDDSLTDSRWSPSDRRDYQRKFEELGAKWATQPYDLYHRPFNLPYVVPDPFWESRRIHDKVALKKSVHTRHRTIVESLDYSTREGRREVRRLMTKRIGEQPSREPICSNDAALVRYALGRRFFISKDGYFGLAPSSAREGDLVAVIYGAKVPLVLRRNGSAFEVVGESYVHGLMQGEAIEKWSLGTKESRRIVLV
ncbi:hypothetical protein GRF29_103g218942 [Pseudopithomyces chartarum]|uniref:Heterokaryon incompatibility domain-containing protein n=1 Tax=Pseudopithomyces chartarum TaxID=1892770 RepID=A0AAN6LWX9_9PLEO|nr:hypothetical protein GRF29_103g218942 [Pseudopithomyces chartarum]